MTESDQESGSYTSTGGSEDDSTVYKSTTETLGDGGLVTCGVVTESTTEGGGSSETVTETDAETDFQAGATGEDRSGSLGDQSEDDGLETGWTTLTDTDNSSSTLTDTLSEALGFDGTVASGNESDALDETTGDTTTETGNPTDTVTDYGSEQLVGSDGLMSMTLTETDSTTDTHNESDNDWATETLGVSGAITGGSDCFTVSDLDASTYNDSGSGPMLTMKAPAATRPSTLSDHRQTSFTRPWVIPSGPAARSAPAISAIPTAHPTRTRKRRPNPSRCPGLRPPSTATTSPRQSPITTPHTRQAPKPSARAARSTAAATLSVGARGTQLIST